MGPHHPSTYKDHEPCATFRRCRCPCAINQCHGHCSEFFSCVCVHAQSMAPVMLRRFCRMEITWNRIITSHTCEQSCSLWKIERDVTSGVTRRVECNHVQLSKFPCFLVLQRNVNPWDAALISKRANNLAVVLVLQTKVATGVVPMVVRIDHIVQLIVPISRQRTALGTTTRHETVKDRLVAIQKWMYD